MRNQLEITTAMGGPGCAIRCSFCPQDKLLAAIGVGPLVQLKLADLKHALATVPTDVHVVFSGYWEPLLNPGTPEMMEYVRAKGHPVGLCTTLTGLTLEGVERIANVAPEYVMVHMPDPNHAAKIPDTPEYAAVLSRFHHRVNVNDWNQMGDKFE